MEQLDTYQIDILPRSDLLSYKVSGYIRTEGDFHQFIREVSEIIIQSGHEKVLSDCRDLEGLRPSILGAIQVVEESFSPDLRGKKIAVIERVENIVSMTYREVFASNRGYSLKYFTRPEEGEAWLQI